MDDAVLLVEDDWDVGRALERAARRIARVEPTLVRCGRDALREIEAGARRYLLAVIDYHLPDIDGAEVARRIRARDPSVMIVLVTGGPDPRAVSHDALDATGARFLLKPFDFDELVSMIENARRETPSARIDAALSALAEEKDLTDAEEHLIRVRLDGVARCELATRLGISEETVHSRIGVILGKWNCLNSGGGGNSRRDRARRADASADALGRAACGDVSDLDDVLRDVLARALETRSAGSKPD